MNKQLIDYVKSESGRGVAAESTKNALRAIGWTDKDIKKAYDSLSAPVSSSKFNKKFILIPVIVLLLLAGGAFAYISFFSKPVATVLPVIDTPAPVLPPTENPPISTNSINPPPVVNPINTDIENVTTIMSEICQGYLTGNNALIIKNASTLSVPIVTNTKLTPVSSCTVNEVYQLGATIVVNLIIAPLSPDKTSVALSLPMANMIFINEEGNWKFDIVTSTKFATEQNKTKVLAGDPAGSPDLVVTGVIVSPVHAVVNNKNLKIVVTIKNIGTKTSETGTPLVADLLGFKDETPVTGGNYEPLLAGGTTEWTFYPYKYNDILKVSDIVGPKTIQIKLNPDRKIVESNYENNTFTQVVQMYTK